MLLLSSPSHSILIFLLVVLLIPRFLLCEGDDDPDYTVCGRSFNCGTVINITYPFWGGDRPQSCGLEGFKLECYEEEYPIFDFQAQKYRVLKIDQRLRTMTMARIDLMDSTCLGEFRNTSMMGSTIFHMTPAVRNLSIFYGCLGTGKNISNEFDCFYDGSRKSAFFMDDIFLGRGVPFDIASCVTSIKVPVLQIVLDDLGRGNINLQEALSRGFEVQYRDEPECSNCNSSGGFCGSNSSSSSFTCYCRDRPYARICYEPGNKKIGLKIGIGISALGAGTLVALGLMLMRALMKQKNKHFDGEMKIKGLVSLRRYTYRDIKMITNSFKEKLGQGGYGSVYKGKLRDGQLVAVKLLKQLKGDAEEFFNEVTSISRTSHVNVVSLVGFCLEGSKRALVYEFMPNGSLEKFIFNKSNTLEVDRQLSWDTLNRISLGIAHGLEYLHQGCNTRILHFDIKPHNILLDANYCPKISDFGLAKICSTQESIVSMLGARGTPGYIAPELVIRDIGGVSHKSDVYSYGMMVLEMVGKRKNIEIAVDRTSETYFPHWVHRRLELQEDLGLRGITNEEDEVIAKKMIIVGLWCIQIHPRSRPSMSQVVEMLKGSIDALQVPPKPSLSSPSRSPMASPCESSSLLDSNDLSCGHSISIVREQYSL